MLYVAKRSVSPIHTGEALRRRSAAARRLLCTQTDAEQALAQMKGCNVHLEGIDECVIAFLTALPAADVRALVAAWHHGLGFPTVSRLAALSEAYGLGSAPSHGSRPECAA